MTEWLTQAQMHSKVKQTQTSEFGAEKGLLQGKGRRIGGSCSKTPTLQCFLGKSFYRPKFGMRVAGYMAPSDWSVWSNRLVFQESCVQPKVAILHLCGGFSSYRSIHILNVYPLRRNQDPVFNGCTAASWLFFLCFCISLLCWLETVWICSLELRNV